MKSISVSINAKRAKKLVFGVFVLVIVLGAYAMESALSMQEAIKDALMSNVELVSNYAVAHDYLTEYAGEGIYAGADASYAAEARAKQRKVMAALQSSAVNKEMLRQAAEIPSGGLEEVKRLSKGAAAVLSGDKLSQRSESVHWLSKITRGLFSEEFIVQGKVGALMTKFWMYLLACSFFTGIVFTMAMYKVCENFVKIGRDPSDSNEPKAARMDGRLFDRANQVRQS